MALCSRKRRASSPRMDGVQKSCRFHSFDGVTEVSECRSSLLEWYDREGRTLPWRTAAAEERDDNVRGYSVWVSEVMLQQTRVATVIDYYNRWMKRWPNVAALAKASLEDVNRVWSGLGYYSRGKRLLEGARKVESQLNGRLPTTAEELQRQLPGVGRYTACAIASIAFGETVGLVDGNVVRVLSRLRRIGADSGSKVATTAFWKIANLIVDDQRPGDFNQALMELGATVCTPRNPSCSECPLRSMCKVQHCDEDIEDADCSLCLPKTFHLAAGAVDVTSYPRKEKKTVRKARRTIVVVFQHGDEYLLAKRPDAGLLANLMEFPHFSVVDPSGDDPNGESFVRTELGGTEDIVSKAVFLGEVFHQFSHISQTYLVWKVKVISKENLPKNVNLKQAAWFKETEIRQKGRVAISTAMQKIFQLVGKKADIHVTSLDVVLEAGSSVQHND